MGNPKSRTYTVNIDYGVSGTKVYDFTLPYTPGTYNVDFQRYQDAGGSGINVTVHRETVVVDGLEHSHNIELTDGLQHKHTISFTTPAIMRTFTLDRSAVDWNYIKEIKVQNIWPDNDHLVGETIITKEDWGDSDAWSRDFCYKTKIKLYIYLEPDCTCTKKPSGINFFLGTVGGPNPYYIYRLDSLTSDVVVKDAEYDLDTYTVSFAQDIGSDTYYGSWSNSEVKAYVGSEWEIKPGAVLIRCPNSLGKDASIGYQTIWYSPYVSKVTWQMKGCNYGTWETAKDANTSLPSSSFFNYSITKQYSTQTSGTITSNAVFYGGAAWKGELYTVNYGGTKGVSGTTISGQQTATLTLTDGTKIGTLTSNEHTAQYYYVIGDFKVKQYTVGNNTLMLEFTPSVTRSIHQYRVNFRNDTTSTLALTTHGYTVPYGTTYTFTKNNIHQLVASSDDYSDVVIAPKINAVTVNFTTPYGGTWSPDSSIKALDYIPTDYPNININNGAASVGDNGLTHTITGHTTFSFSLDSSKLQKQQYTTSITNPTQTNSIAHPTVTITLKLLGTDEYRIQKVVWERSGSDRDNKGFYTASISATSSYVEEGLSISTRTTWVPQEYTIKVVNGDYARIVYSKDEKQIVVTNGSTVPYGTSLTIHQDSPEGYTSYVTVSNSSVSNVGGTTGFTVNGSQTITFTFVPNTYTITYKQGDASSSENLPSAQSFVYGTGVALATNNMTKDTDIVKGYTVTFDAMGGDSQDTSVTQYNYYDYTPDGWEIESGGSGFEDGYVFDHPWNETLVPYFNKKVTYGTVYMPDAIKVGYEFYGWCYDIADVGTKGVQAGTSITPRSDMTMYASWHENNHSVTVKDSTNYASHGCRAYIGTSTSGEEMRWGNCTIGNLTKIYLHLTTGIAGYQFYVVVNGTTYTKDTTITIGATTTIEFCVKKFSSQTITWAAATMTKNTIAEGTSSSTYSGNTITTVSLPSSSYTYKIDGKTLTSSKQQIHQITSGDVKTGTTTTTFYAYISGTTLYLYTTGSYLPGKLANSSLYSMDSDTYTTTLTWS